MDTKKSQPSQLVKGGAVACYRCGRNNYFNDATCRLCRYERSLRKVTLSELAEADLRQYSNLKTEVCLLFKAARQDENSPLGGCIAG